MARPRAERSSTANTSQAMFGYFSKEKALERKHRKLSKKLLNMYAQSPDRRYAAQQLAELETPEALRILLSRFEKRTTNHTVDKEEKNEIREYLIDMGHKVVEPTTEHLRSAVNVNWPISVLQAFLSPEELADLLAELLDAEDIEYGRNPERKEELVLAAGDFESERLGQALVRMLEDANEPIRYLAANAIFKGGYDFASQAIMRCLAEEESVRVTTMILEHLLESDWSVKGFKSAIEEKLPEGYAITRAGTIRRRA